MINKVKNFLKKNGLSQAQVARSLGISSSALSQYLGSSYQGDVKSLEEKLNNFINNYLVKTSSSEIQEIIKTNNLKTCFFMLDEAVVSNEFMIIYGKSGTGKTTTVLEYCKKHPEAVYINTVVTMRCLDFLKKLAEKIGTQVSNNASDMIEKIIIEFKRREAILIIDEAEIFNSNTLDTIRKIHDLSRVPTVLVGTYALLANLRGRNGELEYVINRLQSRYEFLDLSNEEFREFFGEFASHISKFTTHLRRAVNIYAKAKRFAKLNNEELNASHIKNASSMIFLG